MHNKHDTWARAVLTNKKEASIFINSALKLKKMNQILPDMIEHQDNRFITKTFYNRETDILYKLKNKNAYILIEHQSKIDKYMAKRVIEYIVEIIRKDEKEMRVYQNNYKLPLVIPIVLYTGKHEWKAKKSIIDLQEKVPGYKNEDFGQYVLVDMNLYSQEKLLKSKGILTKIVLLDKAKSKKETEVIYDKIESEKLTKEEKEMLEEYACNISVDILSKEKFEEIKEKYKTEGGVKRMLAETLKKEIKVEARKLAKIEAVKMAKVEAMKLAKIEAVKMAKVEAMKMAKVEAMKLAKIEAVKLAKAEAIKLAKVEGKKIAEEMLKNNINEDLIKKWTKLTEKDIEKIKAKMCTDK